MYEMADTTDSWDCSRDEKYDSSVTIDGVSMADHKYSTVDGLEYSDLVKIDTSQERDGSVAVTAAK